MEVVPLGSADEIAAVAADVVEAVVRRKPAAVLGLATGSTPLPAYRELIRRHKAGAGPSYAGRDLLQPRRVRRPARTGITSRATGRPSPAS